MKVLIITGGNIDDDFAFSFLKKNKYNLIFIFPQQAHPTHSSWESTIYKKIVYKICSFG